MAEPVRHRHTKEAATDMFSLPLPRHISTLHIAAQSARAGTRQLSEDDLKLRGHAGRLVVDGESVAAIMIRGPGRALLWPRAPHRAPHGLAPAVGRLNE